MAGLIQEQMGEEAPIGQDPMQDPMMQDPMAQDMGMEDPMMQDMGMEEPMGLGDMDDGEDLNENDPAFQTALQYAMQALYENEAAREVAQGLQASANDPAWAISDTAYEIVSIANERTNDEVPDELLPLLAITILQEVAEIGEAAGVNVSPEVVADAFKEMLLRFLGEQGLDTTELEFAMDEVDPEVFEEAANTEI